MIEITDTSFKCNSCGARNDVKNISIILNDTTRRVNLRLCPYCRNELLLFL